MAVKTWAIDNVQWMFNGQKEVDQDMEEMLKWRSDANLEEDFLRHIQSIQKFQGRGGSTLRDTCLQMYKQIQDLGHLSWFRFALDFRHCEDANATIATLHPNS